MKKTIHNFNYAFLLLIGIILLGCQNDVEPISVTSVTLDASSMTLVEGDSQTLAATISPSNADNKMVLWTSSDSSVAIVKEGVVTAVKPGTATITVKSDDGGKTATCTVTVIERVYLVEKITLDKTDITLFEGETTTLTASITPDNATNKNVSWSSSDTSVVAVENGTVTALKAGNAIITATAEDGGKTATCNITVKAKVGGVSLDQTDITLFEGETTTLTATITPDNATNKNVSWSSSDTSVVAVENGKVTALKAGSAIITATAEDGGKTATCNVTVKAKVVGVSLDQTDITLFEGETTTLTASITPDNATNKNVSWSSSDTSVVAVENGKVTALKAGSAIITATTEDGGKTATCNVIVNAKVGGVYLNQTDITLFEGETATLTATVTPDNATNKNVSWESSDTSVVAVENGKVTALKAGSAIITATAEDGGKTATCNVTVKAKVESISLNITSLLINEGETYTLTATIKPDNATNKNVSWSSSDTSVVAVENGKVTALKAGSAIITATTEDGGKTATCNITVVIPVKSVSLDKTSISLTEGETATLIATINPNNATNKNITWNSSNLSVATVSNGKITALKAGATTITVTTEDGGKVATCSVVVNEKIYPVTGISLNKSELSLYENETTTLIATITPDNATNKGVMWNSSNPSVATVSSSGTVVALKAGTTTITVTTEDGEKTATCSVVVKARVSGVTLNKSEISLYENETTTLIATITPDNATNKGVIWNSSNPSVATVSPSGTVVALKAGTTIITVTTEDGGKTATCYVTVMTKVISITLDKTVATLTEGDVLTLTPTINPGNATNQNVTWGSSNPSVATVNRGKVSALKAGTTTITVTTEDGNKSASCHITVNEKIYPVSSVSLNTTSVAVVVGNKLTLTATINPSNATNKNVSWSSSNTSIATVSATGVVTTLAPGLVNIVVTTEDGKHTAICKVEVIEKIVSGGNENTSDEDWGI